MGAEQASLSSGEVVSVSVLSCFGKLLSPLPPSLAPPSENSLALTHSVQQVDTNLPQIRNPEGQSLYVGAFFPAV